MRVKVQSSLFMSDCREEERRRRRPYYIRWPFSFRWLFPWPSAWQPGQPALLSWPWSGRSSPALALATISHRFQTRRYCPRSRLGHSRCVWAICQPGLAFHPLLYSLWELAWVPRWSGAWGEGVSHPIHSRARAYCPSRLRRPCPAHSTSVTTKF